MLASPRPVGSRLTLIQLLTLEKRERNCFALRAACAQRSLFGVAEALGCNRHVRAPAE